MWLTGLRLRAAMQGINLKLMAEEKEAREQQSLASGDTDEAVDDISVLIADDESEQVDEASTGDG